MNRLQITVYFLTANLFVPLAAGQTVLLSDNFTDGSIINNPAWYAIGNQQSAYVEDDSAGLGTGNAMRIDLTSPTGTNFVHAEFPEVTLGEVGDYIELTFDVRILTPDYLTKGNLFRFGLYDTNGTTAADGSSFASDGFGYFVQADVGGRVANQSYDLRRNRLVSVFNSTYNPDEFGGNASNHDDYAVAYDVPHKAFFRIERSEDPFDQVPDLQVTTNIKGPDEEDLEDIADNVLTRIGGIDTFSFGEFKVGTRGGGFTDSFIIDNLNIVTNLEVDIPEPTLHGDFDNDGDVDGHDFLLWQRGGSPSPQSSEDLVNWQTNYGQTAPPAVLANVPEPNSFVLIVAAVTGAMLPRRRTLGKPLTSC